MPYCPSLFLKKVTFALIDQQEDSNDRENIAKKFKNSEIGPVEDELTGFGFGQFLSLDKLKEKRYIVDDTIFIQLEVFQPQ